MFLGTYLLKQMSRQKAFLYPLLVKSNLFESWKGSEQRQSQFQKTQGYATDTRTFRPSLLG